MMTPSEAAQRSKASSSHFHHEITRERLRWGLSANGLLSCDSCDVLRGQARRTFERFDRFTTLCGGFRVLVGLENFGKSDITLKRFQKGGGLSILD